MLQEMRKLAKAVRKVEEAYEICGEKPVKQARLRKRYMSLDSKLTALSLKAAAIIDITADPEKLAAKLREVARQQIRPLIRTKSPNGYFDAYVRS